jgi:hypothetical protein
MVWDFNFQIGNSFAPYQGLKVFRSVESHG